MLLTQLRLFANIYRDCMVTQSQPRTQSDVKAKCMQTPVQQPEADFSTCKKGSDEYLGCNLGFYYSSF